VPKIEIDLADLGLPTGQDYEGEPYGSTSLTDLIVSAAVEKLVGRDLQHEVSTKVSERIEKEVNARIKDEVEAAFTAPIQRRAPWGDKQGEPTTIKEIIRETLESFLQGKATRDRYSSSKPAANLGELIDESTKHIMNAELKKTVDEARATIHQKVTAAALKAAVDTLAK
jgi:hypothetical protein